MHRNKGQITITIASILGGIGLLAGGFSAYFGTQLASANRFGKVEAGIQVLETKDIGTKERINTLETNINKRFDTLEDLLKKR